MEFKYVGFVGCYTMPGQADPFELSHGGIPHDRSKIGKGVLAIGVGNDGSLTFLNEGEPVIKADDLPNPSYLSFNGRRGRAARLCVVSELGDGKWQPFRCELTENDGVGLKLEADGELRGSGGAYPCHIIHTCAPLGMDLILISNYGEEHGVLTIVCDDEKILVKPDRIVFGDGSKVNYMRQQSSHAHSSCIVPSMTSSSLIDICSADLGSDSIIQFSILRRDHSLECVEKGRLAAPPGSGPRSLMFNPNAAFSNIAVVSLEMTAQVWLIRRRPHDGCLEGLGCPVSLLPEDWPNRVGATESCEMQFNRGRWASDALWSPDGKFVYAAARLHDSISVFQLKYKIDPYRHKTSTGEGCPTSVVIEHLEFVQRIPTGGRTPRCLAMSECGRFLLVAHQHSHDVSSFSRCCESGMLSFVSRLNANCAACVKLVRPEMMIHEA